MDYEEMILNQADPDNDLDECSDCVCLEACREGRRFICIYTIGDED